MFETCQNPLCKGPLGKRKRKLRKFCSDRCELHPTVDYLERTIEKAKGKAEVP